jgi:hypothetical protein
MRSSYRSVPYEIIRYGGIYYLKAGARRVQCDWAWDNAEEADSYFRMVIDQAERRGRYPRVESFRSRLEMQDRTLP